MDTNSDIDEKYRQIPYEDIQFPKEITNLLKKISQLRADPFNEVNKLTIGDTLGDILDLDVHYFSTFYGVGKIQSLLLHKLKDNISNMLPILDKAYKKQHAIKNIDMPSGFYDLPFTIPSDFYDLPFTILSVSKEYEKLINRIKESNADPSCQLKIKETVSGIANLDLYAFSQVDGIGSAYVNILKKLKSNLPTIAENYKDTLNVHLDPDTTPDIPYDLSYCFLNRSLLSEELKKVVGKLEKSYEKIDINTILTITSENLTQIGGFGKKNIINFYNLENLISQELRNISDGSVKLDYHNKCLLVYSKYFDISLNDIDQLLLDDIEIYLFSLDEQSQDIAQSRWGFHHKLESREKIGSRYKITRERIRQIESNINRNISHYIRIHPKVLSQNIRENLTSDLNNLLPHLRSCFETNHLFYTFLEILCLEKKDSILNIQEPIVKPKLLDLYFTENSSPVSHEEVITELTSNFGYSKALAASIIRILENKSRLKITNEDIFPINLGQKEAVAHALLAHPNGLPWKDVIRIVNKAGYCKVRISDERLLNNVFADSDFVYQCDRGAYKHIKYLDITNIDIPHIVNEIIEYFKANKQKSIHLNDFYHQAGKYTRSVDYYDVRHIVRNFGSEYGLYFNGKSGVDSIGLTPNFVRVTQSKLIVELMKKSKDGLTRAEIANRLRSKSLAHASFYLDKMLKAGEVVRVDYMIYTTPEKAFKNVDTDTILGLMEDILIGDDRPIEVDIFRQVLNRELNLSYSKYFYLALAHHNLNVFGWQQAFNLVSRHEIPYSSLTDAASILCSTKQSFSQNIEKLQKNILITKQVAERTIYHWNELNGRRKCNSSHYL